MQNHKKNTHTHTHTHTNLSKKSARNQTTPTNHQSTINRKNTLVSKKKHTSLQNVTPNCGVFQTHNGLQKKHIQKKNLFKSK